MRVETLNMARVSRNRCLARAVAEAASAAFIRPREYKAAGNGVSCRPIDCWFPGSQFCHRGGGHDALTLLDVRAWRCGHCGVRVDRDLNAARNIRDYEERAGSRPASACGVRVRPTAEPAMDCEAGTANRVRQPRSFRIVGDCARLLTAVALGYARVLSPSHNPAQYARASPQA